MSAHRVTLIPGDGTGPEIMETVRRVVDATGVQIDWDVQIAGASAMQEFGSPMPQKAMDSVAKNKVAIKGPVTTPIGTGFRSVNVALRKDLDLYACVRPCKTYPGVRARHQDVDLVIVRENTEDLYAGIEWPIGAPETKALIGLSQDKIPGDSAISVKAISITATERIARFAFDYAAQNRRRKVTAIAKPTIMKYTDGLFFEVARKVSHDYKGKVEFEEMMVDRACFQLVQAPEKLDVLLLPNLYGDFISDLCAGLIGGLGVAPGANIGQGIAVFEATHGSAPDIAGQNKANPSACLLSAKMMLDYLGERPAAEKLERAIKKVFEEGKSVTADMKWETSSPAVGTKEMGEAIIAAMKA